MMPTGMESVAAVTAAQLGLPNIEAPAATVSIGATAPSTFAALIQREVNDVNANVGAAETAMSDLAAGKPVELHEVMIGIERARISVQVFMQVRNKLVESYQDLMRMQL